MRSRWPILALLCVLASLLVPGIASAHSAVGAENRVWAFDLQGQVHVAGQRALTLDLHEGCELAEYDSASGSLLAAKGGALVVRNPISRHAAERLAERGITRGMAEKAIEKGTQYYDRMHGTISHVLEGGMASGKTLQIATNPATGSVVTGVIRSRFNPSVLLPNGTPRFVPVGQ
ncbi:MAG TPA: DUF4258 domain-containing protein [Planctomycetaceae bacterium]|nr:DUF4258 domain-containing protein [Planctomycetaceae bacterium]